MRASPQPHIKHQNQVRGRGTWKAPLPESVAQDAHWAEDHQSIRRWEGRHGAAAGNCRTLLNGNRSCLHRSPRALRTRTFNSVPKKHLPHNGPRRRDTICILHLGADNGWRSSGLPRNAHAPVAVGFRQNHKVGLRAPLHDQQRQTSPRPRFQAQVHNPSSAAERWARPRRASNPSRLRIYAAKATK